MYNLLVFRMMVRYQSLTLGSSLGLCYPRCLDVRRRGYEPVHYLLREETGSFKFLCSELKNRTFASVSV